MSLSLPRPTPRYETTDQNRLRLALEQADARNLKRADVAERTSVSQWHAYTTDTTIGQGQDRIKVDASAGAVTITLPPASDRFKSYSIIKTDATANVVTIDPDGAETINGETTVLLTAQYDAVRVESDGTEWFIL